MSIAWKKDQIYMLLKQRILNGELAPGSRLPRELDFSRELKVGKITLRSALARLEEEGLIHRLPSKGTFVSEYAKQDTILIVVKQELDITQPSQYIVPGITEQAARAGYKTELCFIEYLRELDVEKAVEMLKKKNIFGTLLLQSCYLGHEKEIEIFRKLDRPVLLLGGKKGDEEITSFCSLRPDVHSAWRCGLEHLAGKGYENVRLLEYRPGDREWDPENYRQLFQELGLDHTGTLSYTAGSRDPSAVAPVLDTLLEENPSVQAIYCFSDFFAIEVMKELTSKKIRIPEDIAVMGYCGYPGNGMLPTPLSTVDLDYMNMGRMAVEKLPECRIGRKHIYYSPFKMVVRESTDKRIPGWKFCS